jgi:hypothetical protein
MGIAFSFPCRDIAMKRHLLPIVFFSAFVSSGWVAPAIASVYKNVSTEFGDQSSLVLYENQPIDAPIPAGFGNMVFLQTPDGPLWTSKIILTQINSGTGGNRIYSGTFVQEIPISTGSTTCSGEVTLNRTRSGRENLRHAVTMTRKFTGGANCGQVGETDTWHFNEAVPETGDRADYNAANADTWVNVNRKASTWIEWQLQSGINQLNCRVTPNGRISKVFRGGDRITIPSNLTMDGGSAFRVAGRNSWLLTDQSCYIRANSRYIRPVAMPR